MNAVTYAFELDREGKVISSRMMVEHLAALEQPWPAGHRRLTGDEAPAVDGVVDHNPSWVAKMP